ncbi:hypothetical protein [Kribbella speibonae]|uniref:Uncharacterized protein n=1 Tax=Kribbella speibonae TaxID=1572660 RepID=A0A4R0J3Z3_9ACTN|nr:hypothetical protein [Kribbella speibonae]TCC27172.1 hypothetical protein E0H58_04070 [Kribbella speibonae]TCC35975.1 hypothetical protein E0H92_25115 [Kribbella speibonae]
MKERTWAGSIVVIVLRALGIGLGVGVVVGIIVTSVQSADCLPDEECWAAVGGIAYGALGGGIAMALAILLFAIRLRVGAIFGAGAAIGVLALLAAAWASLLGWGQPLFFLAAVAFSAGVVLQRCHRPADGGHRQWSRPSRVAVLIAAGVVLLGALPAGVKLAKVWSEQRRIEAVIARPLQTDLDGTWPYTVRSRDSGFEYDVMEPPSNGQRIAEVSVTVRNAAPDQAACTGFTDRVEGPVTVTGCTELAPNLWQGQGANGQTHYFVHAEDRQWAYVRAGTYGGADVQRQHDARAEQVARSLRPRSAFPLAAESVGCGFCEWLA